MNVVTTIAGIRALVADARRHGKSIGLMPTLGAMHEGHASLIRATKRQTDFVVVSIFVNPTQFGPGEDFQNYPRVPQTDLALCEKLGVDAVFMPATTEMYPAGTASATHISVRGLSEVLCGRSRPGHFDGVCTVVAKLFNIVLPDKAFFGAKDYQQAAIIRQMVRDLNFPLEIVTCPTVREADGLAMSSRNAYLTPEQRRQAPALYAALETAKKTIQSSKKPVAAESILAAMRKIIAADAPDGVVDYIHVVDPDSLADVVNISGPVVIAMAVKLGRSRLIDNMLVE